MPQALTNAWRNVSDVYYESWIDWTATDPIFQPRNLSPQETGHCVTVCLCAFGLLLVRRFVPVHEQGIPTPSSSFNELFWNRILWNRRCVISRFAIDLSCLSGKKVVANLACSRILSRKPEIDISVTMKWLNGEIESDGSHREESKAEIICECSTSERMFLIIINTVNIRQEISI